MQKSAGIHLNASIVLIVENSKSDLEIIKDAFDHNDYNVQTASSGAKALKSIKISIPDVILLSTKMEDIGCLEIFEQIKKTTLLENTPVIFTGYASEGDLIEKAFNAGAADFITKPINKHILKACVDQNLNLCILKRKLQYDTKEQIKIDRKLKDSETRWEFAVEGSNLGLWDWNLQTNEVFFSSQWKAMLGFNEDEISANLEEWDKRVHPDDKERVYADLNKHFDGETEIYQNEHRLLCKDNTYLWILDRGKVVSNTNAGKPLRMIGTHTDISEHKKNEEEIYSLSTVIKSTSQFVVITTIEGEVVFINEAYLKKSGYKYEEVIGASMFDFTAESGLDTLKNVVVPALLTKEHWQGEMEVMTKGGKVFPAELICTLLKDHNNKPKNLVTVFTDITERKNAEKTLKLERNKLKSILDSMQDGVYIVDDKYEIEYINPIIESEFGPINGRKCYDYFHKNISACDWCQNKNVFKGESVKWEWYSEKANKTFELFGTPLYNTDGSISKLEIFHDITKRKKAEETVKKALDKAVESDRLKSAFLSNMSHEIRTPLNGILGFISLLNMPGLSITNKSDYTAAINKSSNRLINTINDLIDISKIEAGQMNVSIKETKVCELLKELEVFFKVDADLKNLELKNLSKNKSDSLVILTDNDKLYGILRNLIKNAIKCTTEGSIVFGCAKKEEFIEFYVKDTGFGIPKSRQKAIFNRFEQADLNDKRALEGSGLGLSISKAYVEMLGGKIWVESEEGKGSKFIFTIPLNAIGNNLKVVDSNIKNQKKSLDNQKRVNVLIAEDEEISSLYLETVLKDIAQSIEFASTGKETVDKLKNNPDINLILMDIRMPEMNGYQATREIRKFNKDAVIIAQTAYALVGDKEKALEVGCNAYISKPIEKEMLLDLIELHLLNKQ